VSLKLIAFLSVPVKFTHTSVIETRRDVYKATFLILYMNVSLDTRETLLYYT